MTKQGPKQVEVKGYRIPPAPKNLSIEARRLWRELCQRFYMASREHRLVLESAMAAFDRMREAQESIKSNGAVIADRWGQLKPNPSVFIERDSRAAMLKCLKTLGAKEAAEKQAHDMENQAQKDFGY